MSRWRPALSRGRRTRPPTDSERNQQRAPSDVEAQEVHIPRWGRLGILNDRETDEVPGSVLLMSKVARRNEPLGLRHVRERTSSSSLPRSYPPDGAARRRRPSGEVRGSGATDKKTTRDGKIVLEPQPEDTPNDPLNWPSIRRDLALVTLSLYCMIGGGMTTILAAGFNEVADTYGVSRAQVSLTVGLYMLGLGLGSVIMSPTAILFGKRPVYLFGAVLFILSAVWCALSPSFTSLILARIFQGIAVSPVECLPSATIAEIFFLHERAYRLGIYTLLLLGGKNLVPLVSAVIIGAKGWRWVFWVVAMVVGFCGTLLFLFVPETFWNRTPRGRRATRRRPSLGRSRGVESRSRQKLGVGEMQEEEKDVGSIVRSEAPMQRRVGFAGGTPDEISTWDRHGDVEEHDLHSGTCGDGKVEAYPSPGLQASYRPTDVDAVPSSDDEAKSQGSRGSGETPVNNLTPAASETTSTAAAQMTTGNARMDWTSYQRQAPEKSYVASLKPWNGRLSQDSWIKAAVRPFILYAYPSILWSAMVYSLSVGWLIVLSESMSVVYENKDSYYNFSPLQTGLVYISPFVGGILGTAVAGKVSDYIVRAMATRNEGVYEPEFRLVMVLPILLATVAGLMGFGWSAEERDAWIVPTVFFGVISFGCTLGSTTAITFAVDCYRDYAGEALVTLNFSKNILHGLVWSLFVTKWLESAGSKPVFLVIGGIQLGCLLFSVPMYMYGKRARMWTVRKRFMERF